MYCLESCLEKLASCLEILRLDLVVDKMLKSCLRREKLSLD